MWSPSEAIGAQSSSSGSSVNSQPLFGMPVEFGAYYLMFGETISLCQWLRKKKPTNQPMNRFKKKIQNKQGRDNF